MNLAATISLLCGGPGSGCQGPNCGRKGSGRPSDERQWKKISSMSLDTIEKGILTPEGKLFFGYGGEEHADLREQAGYASYDKFYDAGGIRFGVMPGGDVKETGFVEFHKFDEQTVSYVKKIAERLPTAELSIEYFQTGKNGKLFFEESGKALALFNRWAAQQEAN